ncbi:MAG: penicillin-binding protein 2 [Patescibacteria group bacterium]
MKNWRFYFLSVVIFFCFAGVVFRLFNLQILKHSSYKGKAENQQQVYQNIYPQRGEIFLKDRYIEKNSRSLFSPIAINKNFYNLYAVPMEIEEKEETAELLAPLLEMDADKIRERIYKENDPYEPLKNKVSEEIIEQIKELNLQGIKFEVEQRRYFPANETVCHLIGFVRQTSGEADQGQYGVEEAYNQELSGRAGSAIMEKDSKGQLIPISKKIIEQPEEGADLILTIDPNVQFFVENKLKEYIDKFKSPSGSVVIMEVQTGKIIAMASYPKFNPNNYGNVKNINVFINPIVQSLYEPGSIFKPITMAAALDKKVVNPQTTYNDTGKIEVSGKIIENALRRAEGIQTMTQVLEKSLNLGAVFAQQELGKSAFKEYVIKFGFGEKTGIDLNGEVKGSILNLNKDIDINYANISFGQGIAVTPIQMVTAFAAIANNGIMMKPYVVEKIIRGDKEEETRPKEIRRVISQDTASRLTAMLVSVVENGHTQRAGVEGYQIAAKTGTAQIPDPVKGYLENETIHSVIGYYPAFNAQFSMLVKLDRPVGAQYAESTSAPLFGEIAKYVLNYYEIMPSE